MFVGTALVSVMPDVTTSWALTYSPTLPAFALLFVVVPTIPAVWDGVMVLLAASVVNEPVLPLIGALVIVPPEIVGVFSVALPIVGDVPNTATPLPVSSDSTPANCADVVAANCARVPVVVAAPE